MSHVFKSLKKRGRQIARDKGRDLGDIVKWTNCTNGEGSKVVFAYAKCLRCDRVVMVKMPSFTIEGTAISQECLGKGELDG